MKTIKYAASFFGMSALAMLSALNYAIFVFPNRFAPSGLNGICTMIQDLTGVNIGYLSLLMNIPLILLAFFHLNRDFAVKNTIYVLLFAMTSILLKRIDLSPLYFRSDDGSGMALAAIAAGTIDGILYVFMLSLNGSSGGIDIIAATVKKKCPHLELMNVIFCINILISFGSYFVYGMRWEPVICAILYCFIRSAVTGHIRAKRKNAVKYEIITADSDLLCDRITKTLKLTATVMEATGAYSHAEKRMVVCVVSKRNAPHLEAIVRTLPAVTVFKSTVDNGITGMDGK